MTQEEIMILKKVYHIQTEIVMQQSVISSLLSKLPVYQDYKFPKPETAIPEYCKKCSNPINGTFIDYKSNVDPSLCIYCGKDKNFSLIELAKLKKLGRELSK